MLRDKTKTLCIGDKVIGGGHPVLIQSMTNTKTKDVKATVGQIKRLEAAGCDIIRVAVPDMESAKCIEDIKSSISIPLVADIHFDYQLAIASIEYGADKIRINPGNIGNEDRVYQVVEAAKRCHIPIRVGVNSGSLEKKILRKYGRVCAEALVESALNKLKLIESMDYRQLVLSIKSSDVLMSIEAHDQIAKQVPYPLHVGITESGTIKMGTIKSSVGLGIILHKGIGDTIRVSLTGDPVEEIIAGKKILQTLGLREQEVNIISCPTCGRTEINLVELANEVEKRCGHLKENIKIAVMGCEVNGPGEARDADIGIAGGKKTGLIFKKGKVVKKVPEDQLLDAFMSELDQLLNEMKTDEQT